MAFDLKGTENLVRDALRLLYDTQQNQVVVGERPIDLELAEDIQAVTRVMRDAFLELKRLEVLWNTSEFQAQLANAENGSGIIAGLPLAWWLQRGALMLALQTWIAMPQTELNGASPFAVLMQRSAA